MGLVCHFSSPHKLSTQVQFHVGMPGCLSVAAGAAKGIAAAFGKPLVGVHHMVYHDCGLKKKKTDCCLSM